MSVGQEIVSLIDELQDHRQFREQHWEGSFADYIQIVTENPKVTRTAFQRIYDMIMSHGTTEYSESKQAHHPLSLLRGQGLRRRRCDLRSRRPSDEHGQHLQSRGAAVRHGKARASACTARSEAPRAPSSAFSRRDSRSTPKRRMGALYTFRWVNLGQALPEHAQQWRRDGLPHARRAPPPHPARVSVPKVLGS